MPELPEVETIRRGLDRHVSGQTIVQASGRSGRLFRNNPGGVAQVEAVLGGSEIAGTGRRGKFMWLNFSDSEEVLVIHLGMSGQIRVESDPLPQTTELARHEYLRLRLDSGEKVSFIDPRTFGHLTLSEVDGGIPNALAHVAPDPFEVAWDPEATAAKMRASTRAIKTMLLDQSVVSGIGNIYADEALHRAGVHGATRGRELESSQLEAVLTGARDAMEAAIEVGGTSFDSLYVDTEGNPGYFSRSLQVYGQAGERCECGDQIVREIIGGRSHFYCPSCQVPPDRLN